MPGLEIPEWVGQYGLFGLLSLTIVLLVLRGYLQPRSTIEDVRRDRDTRIKQVTEVAEIWHDAYQTERAARSTDLHAVTRTLETSELTLDIVRAWDKTLRQIAGDSDVEA